MAKKTLRRIVHLVAFDEFGAVIEEKHLPYDDYYDGNSAIVDSNDYRLDKGIRRMKGEVYGVLVHRELEFRSAGISAG